MNLKSYHSTFYFNELLEEFEYKNSKPGTKRKTEKMKMRNKEKEEAKGKCRRDRGS